MKLTSKCRSAATNEGVWPERRRSLRSMPRPYVGARRGPSDRRSKTFRRADSPESNLNCAVRIGEVPRPRASIDTAALVRAFAADGLHGTPIERVVAACGVAKPTLYARGGDKDELFALAVEAEVERLIGRLAASAPPARALDDYLREEPAGARLLLVTARHQ